MTEQAASSFDFLAFFDSVVSSSATTTEKLLALVLGRHVKRRDRVVFPSRTRMLDQASCSLNSFKRAHLALKVFFEASERLGQPTAYLPKPIATAAEIEAAILATRTQIGTGSPGPKLDPASNWTRPQIGSTFDATRTQIGSTFDATRTQIGSTEEVVLDSELQEEEYPYSPQNPERSVWMGEDGLPRVVNGKRVALEALLGGKMDLDAAIVQVAPKVPAGSPDEIWVALTAEVAKLAATIEKKKKRQAIPEEYPRDFEEFWKIYPRRQGKAAAFKKWNTLTLAQRRRAWSACKLQLATLTAQTKTARGNMCPHPATWINQGRFDDDVQTLEKPCGLGVGGSNYSASGAYVGELL